MRSPATKVFVGLILLFSAACKALRMYQAALAVSESAQDPGADVDEDVGLAYIMLIIGRTPPLALWTVVTSPFVEPALVPFLISVVMLATGGRICEATWSTGAYVRFAVILIWLPMIVQAVVYTSISKYLPNPVVICGSNGLIAGITVALKQLLPGHTIVLFHNRVRVQLQWVPLIFMLTVLLLQLAGIEENLQAYSMGFVLGWVYLRFFQKLPQSPYSGDASDAFAFSQFFPSPFRTVIDKAVGPLYNTMCSLGLLPQHSAQDIDSANQRYVTRLNGTLLPLSSSPRTTTERRNLMLKALDRRKPLA